MDHIIKRWRQMGHFERSVALLVHSALYSIEAARIRPLANLIGDAYYEDPTEENGLFMCRLVFPPHRIGIKEGTPLNAMYFILQRDKDDSSKALFNCRFLAADDSEATTDNPTTAYNQHLSLDMMEVAKDGTLFIPTDKIVAKLADEEGRIIYDTSFGEWFEACLFESNCRPLLMKKPSMTVNAELMIKLKEDGIPTRHLTTSPRGTSRTVFQHNAQMR